MTPKCAKCGFSEWHGPRYNAPDDSLEFKCAECGFTRREVPRDRALKYSQLDAGSDIPGGGAA